MYLFTFNKIKKKMTNHNHIVVCLALIFFEDLARACAVCGAGQEGSDFSFILSTAILSFVPIILFAIIFYLFKFLKSKKE